jgi:regulatory protein YycI of two-component signal transduction system YycFG
MIKFFLKCFILICVLLVGILFGMQKASNEMEQMSASEELGAFNIQKENGVIAAEILGESVDSHDLKEKQEELQEVKAFNFFSEIGEQISSLITKVFQFFVAILFSILGKL